LTGFPRSLDPSRGEHEQSRGSMVKSSLSAAQGFSI
jgi:hypothetical protein